METEKVTPPPKAAPTTNKVSFSDALLAARKSTDAGTRRAGFLFWAGILGTFAFLTLLIMHWVSSHKKSTPVPISEHSGAAGEEGHAAKKNKKTGMMSLGAFTIHLTDRKETKESQARETFAEVEVVLECETLKDCRWIEENLPRFRDSVTSILVPMDRMILISAEGKAELRAALLKKLMSDFPDASILDLYFINILFD